MANNVKKIYGVLGYPVKHSLSPEMHNAAFGHLKIDAEYKLFEVRPPDLDPFLKNLDKENIYGLNITIPYKERVLDFVSLDKESLYLRQIKAVNTIVKEANTWKGFNTDIPGFFRHLKEHIDPINKKVAILGAGGAARALTYVLVNAGASEIAIFDIDNNKAKELSIMINDLSPKFKITVAQDIDGLDIKNKDLLINATPVGLKETDPCLIKKDSLHKDLFVYDLIYNPSQTKLLVLAAAVGAKTSNGLGMLLYQGMLSFEIWTGVSAPQDIMRNALEENLKNAPDNH